MIDPHQVDHLSLQGYSQECEKNAEGEEASKEEAKVVKSRAKCRVVPAPCTVSTSVERFLYIRSMQTSNKNPFSELNGNGYLKHKQGNQRGPE